MMPSLGKIKIYSRHILKFHALDIKILNCNSRGGSSTTITLIVFHMLLAALINRFNRNFKYYARPICNFHETKTIVFTKNVKIII